MSTIDYYNANAQKYFDTTVGADMSKQYDLFLKYVRENGRILDFGCGSGRDSFNFKKMGFKVDAIDGSEELCKLAREKVGIDAKCMNFLDFEAHEEYDGIWACASLLHLKKPELIDVMKRLREGLVNDGYLYTSLKNGTGEEITPEGRYYLYLPKEEFLDLSSDAGLQLVDYSASKSTCNPNETRFWNSYMLKRK